MTEGAKKQPPPVEGRDPSYFGYYGLLMHQQNMLADTVRTQLYRDVVQQLAQECFTGKTVMDVGAGSGVLSFFSCQSGARKVYAVEASAMALKMRTLIERSLKTGRNPWLAPDRIEVLNDKIERLTASDALPKHCVDTIISEPIGVLLVHERMLESYIHARDHYLKPGGHMLPSTGTIHLAPFSDGALWLETMQKARWWQQPDFFGVDFSPLFSVAEKEFFSMPVVGTFSPMVLMAHPMTPTCSHTIDFRTATIEDLQVIDIPIRFAIGQTGVMHGLAGWFDCDFMATRPNASAMDVDQNPVMNRILNNVITLSTHPAMPVTHWQQIRFVMRDPLAVNQGDVLVGHMRMKTNAMRSYDIDAEVWIEDANAADQIRPQSRRSGHWDLQEQAYNYSSSYAAQQQQTGLSDEVMKEWVGLYTRSEQQ